MSLHSTSNTIGVGASTPTSFTKRNTTPSVPTPLTPDHPRDDRDQYPLLSPRPVGCLHPYPVRTQGNVTVWRRCGRPKCSRGCRDLWAWKRVSAVKVSVQRLPPTHFLTLRPGPTVPHNSSGKCCTKFWRAARRRGRCPELEYLAVREWKGGVQHAHALIRVPRGISTRALRRIVRDSGAAAGVRVSCKRVRTHHGAVNYLCKHTRRREKKAELPPRSFRGKIYVASRGFLTASVDELWREFRRRETRGGGITWDRRSKQPVSPQLRTERSGPSKIPAEAPCAFATGGNTALPGGAEGRGVTADRREPDPNLPGGFPEPQELPFRGRRVAEGPSAPHRPRDLGRSEGARPEAPNQPGQGDCGAEASRVLGHCVRGGRRRRTAPGAGRPP